MSSPEALPKRISASSLKRSNSVGHMTITLGRDRFNRIPSAESREAKSLLSTLLQGHSFTKQLEIVRLTSQYLDMYRPADDDDDDDDDDNDEAGKDHLSKINELAGNEEETPQDCGAVGPYQSSQSALDDTPSQYFGLSAFDNEDVHVEAEVANDAATQGDYYDVIQDVDARLLARHNAAGTETGSPSAL
jgi:hypothetical protein